MDERFVEVKIVESKNVKIREGENLVLDKAKCIVYVPFITLKGFEHFYGKLEEIKKTRKRNVYTRQKTRALEILLDIKADIEKHNLNYMSDDNAGLERAIYDFIEPRIEELKKESVEEE